MIRDTLKVYVQVRSGIRAPVAPSDQSLEQREQERDAGLAAVTGTARARGGPGEQVHVEYFGAAPQDTSGDAAFEVKIASSGKTYAIAADKTVTAALLEHGIDIPVSCEQGVCGTCITRVLEGEPDHRDLYFTDEEHAANDQFTPCCSRAKSKVLVLDL